MEDIKTLIKNFIEKDDSIAEINKNVKELRKEKSILEENIKTYMIAEGIAKIDISGTTIRISKSKPAKKINKKIVMEVLENHVESQKVETIVDDIFNVEEENVEEVFKLERSKKK